MPELKKGSIVTYVLDDGTQVPAIVVKIHSDTCVNLRLFYDSYRDVPHVTSVLFDETGHKPCTWLF